MTLLASTVQAFVPLVGCVALSIASEFSPKHGAAVVRAIASGHSLLKS